MRVAVLGQGSIGRRHAGNLLDLGHDVVAWDPVAGVLDGVTSAMSPEAALAAADAAVVASPSSDHAAQARLALEHGCHVLVEKPLALTAQEIPPLADLADERGLVLGVAMNLRFHPAVIALHDAVTSGAIGRPLVARAWFGSWLPGWRPGTDYRQSYSARRDLGGGVLLDAIHEIDYLTWILGPVASVAAKLTTVSDLEIDVEDLAQLQLTWASGTEGVLSLDYLDRSYDRGCRIIGSEGTTSWSWSDGRVLVAAASGETVVTTVPADVTSTYPAEIEAFLADAIGTGRPATTADAALHATQVVEAARRSNETQRRVDVGPAGIP